MWFLERFVAMAMRTAIKAGLMPTSDRQAAWEAARTEDTIDTSKLLAVSSGVAQIKIEGILTPKPSWLAYYFGGGNTTYQEIRAAIAEAEMDTRVKSVDFLIASPGGNISGLFDTMDAIKGMAKPTRAIVSDMAASAAYGLASQANEIVATGRAVRFGSIGILATYFLDDKSVTITSTKAPKKAPDPATEEGQADIRAELDAMHNIFVESIAAGRGADKKTINEKYGQGGTFLAEEALQRGMIDKIEKSISAKSTNQTRGSGVKKGVQMDLATLKAQHPEVYAAVMQEGVNQERDRVTAHLTLAEQSGAMGVAIKAIKDGSGITATVQAAHLAAGMATRDIANRQQDDSVAAAAADGAAATGSDSADDMDEQVTAKLEARFNGDGLPIE